MSYKNSTPALTILLADFIKLFSSIAILRTFGLENPLSTRFWTAVKTGTSKDMRDNWCIGFSQHFTVAVWVGNFSGKPMWNVSGISGSAQIWLDLMNYLDNKRHSKSPKIPKGIIVKTVNITGNNYEEYFLSKYPDFTSLADIDKTGRNFFLKKPKFLYPHQGIYLALDPDIAKDNQRVLFQIDGYRKGIKIMINDELHEIENNSFIWEPYSGKHIVR
ncbi:MAG TPA: hypothetical protein HPP56_05525 [Nitrospirae bacterium]|nr:hypothetical protein [Nitrospirota bacterium]